MTSLMIPATQPEFAPWSISYSVTFALVFIACGYVRGWLRLRSTSPNLILPWQLAAFMSGMFALWIVLGSPLRSLHHELLSIHMVDHVLLMAVAPPLILLGAAVRSFLHALPQRFLPEASAEFLPWFSAQPLGRILGNPIFCWLAAVIALIGWHIPAAFELAMRSNLWHEVEYATFFATGILFWWPVIHPWPSAAQSPRWSAVLYLFFATFPCDMLSAFLTFCDRVVYPSYLSGNQHFSISPLQDQEYAGALMWVCVTFIYLLPAVVITTHLLSHSHDPNRLSSSQVRPTF
ncbi:MAG: putative rane protein [Acidobacteriaceae bacterium]|nr:putative rane protein [Acidobacteriaceae bacterium]